ncbi:MAG: tyrosine-type recombinase/integrase [Rickettsiales bacterium]|nr:tyrosine-type recombinase/integrase [Rickettsiales bacterium]
MNDLQVNSQSPVIQKDNSSIEYWANVYFNIIVSGSSDKTIKAKQNDLSKFISFFMNSLNHSNVDYWTPSITKHFQKTLINNNYKPSSVNRIIASVKHFGKWLNKQKKLIANPIEGVKDIVTDEPDWNGLTDSQIMKLKAACEQRLKICNRISQNPLMETVIFFVLLNTGLREFELVSLNVGHYYDKGFHHVQRKGNKISKKIPVPLDARQYLEQYLNQRFSDGIKPQHKEVPLFISRYGNRLSTHDVIRICHRISNQAYAQESNKFRLNPHMLRHTFLKRIADKHGVHVAQKMSGNVSMSEIFRYTKPSQNEIDKQVEELFL